MRCLSVLVAVLIATAAFGGGIDPKTAVPVLLKVLTYDLNFDARGRGPFTVLVVADGTQARGLQTLMTALREIAVTKIKSRPLKFVAVEYADDAGLQDAIDRNQAGAVLVVPGMAAGRVQALWEVVRVKRLYALSIEAAMVESCLTIGMAMSGDRPQILINRRSAAAVGADFDSAILRVARVIH